jgi:rhodanese-related sulfurtransferase
MAKPCAVNFLTKKTTFINATYTVIMAKVITKEELQERQPRQLRMIDIRSKEEYDKMHIPEAINIPAENLPKELTAFNEEDTIVCICNYGKERSQQATELLDSAGFKHAFYLKGGTMGWDGI